MRYCFTFLSSLVLSAATAFGQSAPVCTGLACQQLPATSCPNGGTTSISGVVYAPNGTDPLPNVQVYIPNSAVEAFPAGVQCPDPETPPSGSPLVGAITDVNGVFKINNVPVGSNIPLVIVTGRWRRQIVIQSTTACGNTALNADLTHLPRSQAEGDIPLFAIPTGSSDSVECVLRKVGIADSEFTNPSSVGGIGRIQLFSGSGSAGAQINSTTPSQTQLMSSFTQLQKYDVLMLPCQGQEFLQDPNSLANFVAYANAGGRVYSSHYSYVWLFHNAPFDGVANWDPQGDTSIDPDPGIATINQNFAAGLMLAEWLQQPAISATATQGQIAINTLRRDTKGVIAPTESWLTLNNATYGNPMMQMVFNTPIAAPKQCGRVLFNEYHVETTNPSASQNVAFPQECASGTTMTPQEKLLEYMLFELTNDGAPAALTPATQDFSTQAINLPSAPIAFTLTNKSVFQITNPQIAISGPFSIVSNTCSTLTASASCTISVVFTPTALGAATGTLSVSAGATSLQSTLTGTGGPELVFSPSNLSFGSVDAGATSSPQTLSIINNSNGTVPVGLPTISPEGGAFSLTSNCPAALPAGESCTAIVIFKPTTSGPATGTVSDEASGVAPVTLTGNGAQFTIAAVNKSGGASSSGSVIAGDDISFYIMTSPVAGFANPVTLSCTTTVPGSTCSIANPNFIPNTGVSTGINITTTSEYTVIGYTAGVSRPGLLWILALTSGAMLLINRRRVDITRWGVLLVLIGLTTIGMTGCSGKLPDKNSIWTPAGTYTYTVNATDGFLVHTASYSLTVTTK